MNSFKAIRISAMVIVGLYAGLLIFGSNREVWGSLGLVFTSFTILIAAGIMFLAWIRPLDGGLVVLFLALLLFLVNAYQSIEIFGANSGLFIVINFMLVIPLLLAGVLLLVAYRAMK